MLSNQPASIEQLDYRSGLEQSIFFLKKTEIDRFRMTCWNRFKLI